MHGIWNVNLTNILDTWTLILRYFRATEAQTGQHLWGKKTWFIRKVSLKGIEEATGFNEKLQNRQEQIDKFVVQDRITTQLPTSVLKFLSAVTSAQTLALNHSQRISFICLIQFKPFHRKRMSGKKDESTLCFQ